MLENAYAEALQKVARSGKEPKAIVSLLHEALARRGRQALLPRIARAFARIAERDLSRNALVLSVAGAEAKARKEAKQVLDAMHVDMKDVEVREDDTLIGGWRLEGREHLYDASFKKHLLSIYAKVINR